MKRMCVKTKIQNSPIGKVVWPFLIQIKLKEQTWKRKKDVAKIYHQALKTDKHIFYCGVCESSNMGDIAQTFCTLNWMKDNYPDYQVFICNTSIFRDPKCDLIGTMRKVIKPTDIIFFQSGYNTHDLGDGREDLMHQMVIQALPDNEIIMLPQTVYFQTNERREKCSKVYNAHKKMLFFSRDLISQKYAEEMFTDLTVKLYPDIVTSLIGYPKENADRKGIYLCRRKIQISFKDKM